MRIEYDPQADALYISVQERTYVDRSHEIEPGIVVDLDDQGRAVGFEVLSVSKRYKADQFKKATLENIALAR